MLLAESSLILTDKYLKGGIAMSNEERNEVCRAFAMGFDAKYISEVLGVTEDVAKKFESDNADTIAKIKKEMSERG